MAYGYNGGDQRRQSVRLAGRTTPTPRRATSSNPQRPQEQPRPSSRQQTSRTRQSGRPSTATSAQQDSRLGARTRQRQAEAPQLRRNGARQPGIHINRFFSHPQGGRDGKPYRSTSYVNAPALPARRLCLALCSILICLVFVLMSSCMSHGSAHRRGQAAQGPRRARLFFRLFDLALAMASRHDAPYLSDRPCMVGAALRRRYHPPKCLRAYVPHHGLYL